MHLVDKHIFDIRYDNESSAIDMQRRISSISNDKLFAAISTVFDEYDVPSTVRFNQLELNIGRIRESHLEEDLIEAVTNALRVQLKEQMPHSTVVKSQENAVVQEQNDTAIFEHFLLSGTVPWWIRDRNNFDIRKAIDGTMSRQLRTVMTIVRRNATRTYFLQRLVYNLNQKQLESLIHALAPAEATQVIQAAKNIEEVQNKRKIVATDTRGYRNKVWEFVLTYLLIDRGTAFNQKMFVQATLARLAHHYNVEYGAFLTLFYEAVTQLNKEISIPKGLSEIIKEIYNDRDKVAPKKNNAVADSQAEITAVYTALLAKNATFDSRFASHLLELIQTKSSVFESFLHRESSNSVMHLNLAKAITDIGLHQLVHFIEPTSQRVVVQFSQKVQQLKDSSSISVSGSSQEFRDAKWSFILRALLVDRGSQFNLKSFVKSTLASLAAHFNVDLHDIMHYVLLELDAVQSVDTGSLASILLEIKEDERQKIETKNDNDIALFKARIKFQWLEYALVHTSFPAWSSRHQLNPSSFQRILMETLENQPSEMQKLLRAQLKENRKRHFIIRQLDEKGRHQIIRFLNAKAAEKITLYDNLLDKIQERRNVAVNTHEFESLKWSTILEILIEEKGSFFNYKTFVLRSLYELSNRLNISFEVLFSYVLEVSSTLPNMPESPLQNALLSLRKELTNAKPDSTTQQITMSKELTGIWNKIKQDAPEDARMLIIFLQRMQQDALFRSQFDLAEWLEKHPDITKEIFQNIIRAFDWKPEIIAEALQQHSMSAAQKIIHFIGSEEHRFIEYYLKDLETLFSFSFSNHLILSKQATLFSLSFLAVHKQFDKHYFFQQLVIQLSRFQGITKDDLLRQLQETMKNEAPHLNSTLALSISKVMHEDEQDPIQAPQVKLLDETISEETIPEQEIDEEMMEEMEKLDNDLEGIYIENAGIVILWPFFKQLFQMLELVEDDAFVSIAAKIRGVHLMQYMCTGETSHPEHELILNKILCGIPINIPIDASFKIASKEKEVIESMMLGVLANWPRMKDSNVEALRETFMSRSAKISFEEETIDMHVEKKTVDILFESMPWSFTFVSLPWMKKPLRTIWN
jgi:hypothetical protein